MMRFLKRLLHVHDWTYYNKRIPQNMFEAEGIYHEYRMCLKCGELQEVDIHCFGLNPPEYIKEWNKVEGKPRFKLLNDKTTVEIIRVENVQN